MGLAPRAALAPALAPVHDRADAKHDGRVDQDAEEADRRRDGELEEVAGPDERRGAGDAIRSPETWLSA